MAAGLEAVVGAVFDHAGFEAVFLVFWGTLEDGVANIDLAGDVFF